LGEGGAAEKWGEQSNKEGKRKAINLGCGEKATGGAYPRGNKIGQRLLWWRNQNRDGCYTETTTQNDQKRRQVVGLGGPAKQSPSAKSEGTEGRTCVELSTGGEGQTGKKKRGRQTQFFQQEKDRMAEKGETRSPFFNDDGRETDTEKKRGKDVLGKTKME